MNGKKVKRLSKELSWAMSKGRVDANALYIHPPINAARGDGDRAWRRKFYNPPKMAFRKYKRGEFNLDNVHT